MTMNTNQDMLKSSEDRFLAAIDIILADVIMAQPEARNEAKRLGCTPELLTVRDIVLDTLKDLRDEVKNNG